jgi:hypothetical protein
MKTTSITKGSLLLCLLLIVTLLKGYAATFVVDNSADTDNLAAYTAADGTNTLRKCMRLANANANTPTIDIINFAAGLTGGITITLTAALPFISDPLLIDGFTANGYAAPNPRVSILGGANPNVFNLTSGGSNSTLRGFSLSNTANDAVYINGATNVTIAGCWIGLLATGALPGTAAAKVGGHGIYITGSSNNCIIGIATVAGKNVISGCLGHGVVAVNSSGVVFKNNYIGTNTTGTAAISNGIHGINIDGSPSAVIGGAAANEGNLISGNNQGIIILNASNGAILKGNKIGTNLAGTAALANSANGVVIDNSTSAVVGGAAANEGNLLSGNTQSGIVFSNASSNAIIKGNIIGTNLAGSAALANGEHGINIYTSVLNTIIGGGLAGEGNLISGNTLYGINNDVNSAGAVIQGNKIGTNMAGTAAIGNKGQGVFIKNSNNVTIGGGSKALRNIISGNGTATGGNGIGIVGSNGLIIQGNFCGLSVTGLTALPNFDTGLSMTNSSGNTIGGASYMQRNVCSGNSAYGMYLANLDNTTITGNYVGTDSTGNAPLGNAKHGISANSGCNLLTWTANVVGANGTGGVEMNGMDLLTVTNNTFYGNYIGLGIDGTTDLGNLKIGLRFGGSSTNNIIGGTAAGQRNYFSGNGDHGIMLDGQSVSNSIKGNYVGSDITGLAPVSNNGIGILFLDGSSSNIVGGAAAGEGNLLCCSATADGFRSQISSNNTLYGNLIGVDKNSVLTPGFGNAEDGVYMMSYQYLTQANNSTIIGGLAAGQANIIANNGRDGVRLAGYPVATTNFNPIIGNKIYCNGGLGINMENNNAIENEGIAAPTVTSSTANAISGTGTTGNTIHVYRNQYTDGARCDCEGEIYVGTTTVAGGTWSLTHGLGLTTAQALSVTATQTNSTNSTSEFWVCSVPLPVDLLSLEAKKINTIVSVSFTVSNETNIHLYRILKSKDGINFEIIGSVMPVNGPGVHAYSFEDLYPFDGINYYKIQTVENDGRTANSKIVFVNTNTSNTSLYPNPATEEVTVMATGIISRIELHNSLGQLVYEKNIEAPELVISLTDLATGVYYVKVYEAGNIGVYKLEKK